MINANAVKLFHFELNVASLLIGRARVAHVPMHWRTQLLKCFP